MHKFIYKLTRKILELQVSIHKKRIEHLYKKMTRNSSSKFLHEDIELMLDCETKNIKAELNVQIKEILNKNDNNPDKLLDFIKDSGTDVFKINNANYLLKFIGEEEGFIPPLRGINAFFLNLFINFILYKKIIV